MVATVHTDQTKIWNKHTLTLSSLLSTTTSLHSSVISSPTITPPLTSFFSSALTALTLLVGWQERHPACEKLEWWGAGMVICLQRGADLHMAQLMPLPLTVSCFSEIQIGFAFLVPAHPGSPGQRAVKRVCMCVCPHCFPLHSHLFPFPSLHSTIALSSPALSLSSQHIPLPLFSFLPIAFSTLSLSIFSHFLPSRGDIMTALLWLSDAYVL